MQPFKQILEGIANRDTREDGDYLDTEGFLVCGKCHTRKQRDIEVSKDFRSSGIWRVIVPCECRKAELKAEEKEEKEEKFRQQMKTLQRDGITDPAYLRCTFDQDDCRNPQVSDVCKKYVRQWKEMRANNIGILFYGDVGTGKSFLACCIANALLSQLVSVSVTNFPRLLNYLQQFNSGKGQDFVDRLQHYSLLVIDDLGVERDTAYSAEQIFNVVDTRSRSGKPLIVTTNLPIKDLKNPPSLAYKRIYDRVLEMCPIHLKLVGESRRTVIASDREDKARRLLGLK